MLNSLLTVPLLLATAIGSPTSPIPSIELPPKNEPPALTPIVRTHYTHYQISGSTATTLQSQMTQFGPFSEVEGQHYDANTVWHVQWSIGLAMTEVGCLVTSVEGSVDVTFTLPQWNSPADAPSSLITSWNQFLAALQVHENGHMAHGIAAGSQILQTLRQLPVYPSCDELKITARSLTKKIIQHYNQLDIAYDRATQHGLTQGAIFPPIQPSALEYSSPE